VPVISLVLNEISEFRAEFDEFESEFKKSPVVFLVLALTAEFFRGVRCDFKLPALDDLRLPL